MSNHNYKIPDFKSLIDYFNEAGLYNLDALKNITKGLQFDNIEDIGTKALVLTGMGKQYILEGKMQLSYEVFQKAKSIVKENENNLHTDIIAYFYYEYTQIFSIFKDEHNVRRNLTKALHYAKSDILISQINYVNARHNRKIKNDNYFNILLSCVNRLKDKGKYATYIFGLFRIGVQYARDDDHINAKYYYKTALKESINNGLKKIESNIHNSFGYLLIREGKLSEGIKYLKNYKDNVESFSTQTLMIENIAYAYYLMGDYATSIDGFLEAYNLAKINGVIQQLPIQCYYLGECYDKLDKPHQALSYYKLGYDHAKEQLKMGFSYSGERPMVMEAYTQYLEKIAYTKFKEAPTENVFHFAIGKSWKEITHLFQYHLLMVHLQRVIQSEDLYKTLEIKESTFFAIKARLAKQNYLIPPIREISKSFDATHKINSFVLYIENNLMNLSWKEAHKRFEKDIFRFLYQKYGFQKRRLEDVLELSYPSVWAKVKRLEGPYTEGK